ncbi:unnamed protein product [Ilex paraguariensis]|uniref:FAS1 domain-containing protein n=1 Tax=Ilex paraguariensis TaxID=185542 RepID=A0ABC8UVM0_9AQUA
MRNLLSSFPLLVIFFIHCTPISAQSPAPAPALPLPQPPALPPPKVTALGPAPSGPANVIAILQKAGGYITFIKLLKSTQVDSRIYSQLNNSNVGLTIFAPADSAFASLKSGTLNALNAGQKAQLVQFHIIPSYISLLQFQTLSNPVSTQAGGSDDNEFPLNITTSGSHVNLTTGIVNAAVIGTVYTDNQLAVYQVDKVLLPMYISVSTAPAQAPSNPKKEAPDTSSTGSSVNSSGAVQQALNAIFFLVAVCSAFLQQDDCGFAVHNQF